MKGGLKQISRGKDMKIRDIETKIVSIDLDEPKFLSTRPIKSREYLIVKITTDQEVVGWGMTFASLDMKVVVDKSLSPLLLNQDPFYVEQLWEEMFNRNIRWSRRGSYVRAISAVDIALWDIVAKACGQPLFRLLGTYRKKIPVYASGGYYELGRQRDEVEGISREIGSYVEQGFTAVKIRFGGLDLEMDLLRVQAAREALGENRRLFLDCNNAYKTDQISYRALKKLADIGVDWIEEPFMPDELDRTARLKKMTAIPIATGEMLCTRWDFKQLIERDIADIWQPDVTVLGGITEWKKVMAMASVWGITVAPHAMHEIHVQLAGSSPETSIVEYFDTTGDIVNYGKLLKHPLKAKDGYLEVPEKPGVGMEFDDDLVANYEI